MAAFLDDPAIGDHNQRAGRSSSSRQQLREDRGEVLRTGMRTAIVNVLQYAGKRLDPEAPLTEARLPDGSRVHVAMDPCSRRGPVVTIRKHSRTLMSIVNLVKSGRPHRIEKWQALGEKEQQKPGCALQLAFAYWARREPFRRPLPLRAKVFGQIWRPLPSWP